MLAVGYRITSDLTAAKRTGHLIIRNSWGSRWGIDGYGFLPFGYVTRQLACDFWTLYR